MIWRTRGANAHSCHVFPLFFLSTLNHFGLFLLSFACYDSENIALIFHPLFFSLVSLPPLLPSSSVCIRLSLFLRCLFMLRSFIEFISIYVPRCDGGDDRDERLKSDEIHKGFYVRRCEMCMNGYMIFFLLLIYFCCFFLSGIVFGTG